MQHNKDICKFDILSVKGLHTQRPKAEVDGTLRYLQSSSYPTKAEFNNCFIVHSKYFPVLKGVSPFRSLFCSPKITLSRSQVFSVNGLRGETLNYKMVAMDDFKPAYLGIHWCPEFSF